jgi:hypothetical protein
MFDLPDDERIAARLDSVVARRTETRARAGVVRGRQRQERTRRSGFLLDNATALAAGSNTRYAWPTSETAWSGAQTPSVAQARPGAPCKGFPVILACARSQMAHGSDASSMT